SGATNYVLQRRSNGGAFATIASPAGPSYTDNSATANTTYVYRVQAADSLGQGNFSNSDLATTMTFTAITPHVTPVAAAHLNEILSAVNAVRAASGLSAVTWSGILQGSPPPAAPAPGVKIYAEHILAL